MFIDNVHDFGLNFQVYNYHEKRLIINPTYEYYLRIEFHLKVAAISYLQHV